MPPRETPRNRSKVRDGARVAKIATGLLVLGGFACATPGLAQSPADSAWLAGDTHRAAKLYADRLAADPADELALHRLALVSAWDERYGESLDLFGRLLTVSPDNPEARVDRARVIAWSGDLERAIAEVDAVLEEYPSYLPALMARARYAAWEGRLVEAENRWREAEAFAPDDDAVLAGLGQTLRWQGRQAAAQAALERALELDPGNDEAAAELEALRADLAPRGRPGVRFDSDSDTNDILTVEADAGWHPTASLNLRARAYYRDARFETGSLERTAGGVLVAASTSLEPGWAVSGGLGLSGSDVDGGVAGRLEAAVRSPRRHPVTGSLSFTSGALDESALLIDNRVTMDLLSAGVSARPAPGWRIDGSASVGWFRGSESNRRLAGSVYAGRTLSESWRVGLFTRAFGFEKRLTDGYFDPDLYWLAEASATWTGRTGRWTLTAEGAPGVQIVEAGGTVSATIRATSTVGYGLGAGRVLSLRALYSTSGLAAFSSGATDYRYLSVGLQLDWAVR